MRYRTRAANVAWDEACDLYRARERARSPVPKASRAAALALIRAGLGLLDGEAPSPKLRDAVVRARRALAGTREIGDVFEIRTLTRILVSLEKAWNGKLPMSAQASAIARAMLETVDADLVHAVDDGYLALVLSELREGEIGIDLAVARVMRFTRALSATGEIKDVKKRVKNARLRGDSRKPLARDPTPS
jgi:hypothetical protein